MNDQLLPSASKQTLATGIFIVFVLLFGVSLTGSVPVLQLAGLTKINGTLFFISRLLHWLCLGLIWLYAIRIEKQSLVIWQERRHSFLGYAKVAGLIFVIMLPGLIIIQQLLHFTGINSKSENFSEINVILQHNKFLLVFTVFTAAVVEELIFRAYMLPRLDLIFNNSRIAIFISALLFGLLHYKYGTMINMIGPFFIGLVFGYFYWRFRNIKVLIFCHFLWDLVALMMR